MSTDIARSLMPAQAKTFAQAFRVLDFLHYEYAPMWRFAPASYANRVGRRFTQDLLILDGHAGAIAFTVD